MCSSDLPLGAHWLSGAGLLSVHDALFLVVFAILAVLCWLSARLAKRAAPAAAAPAAAAAAPAAAAPAGATAKRRVARVAAAPARAGQPRKETARNRPDPAEALASGKAAGLLTRVLPYVTVVIAAFAPLAAAIYLLTTVAWTLVERRLFLRRTAQAARVRVPETG